MMFKNDTNRSRRETIEFILLLITKIWALNGKMLLKTVTINFIYND